MKSHKFKPNAKRARSIFPFRTNYTVSGKKWPPKQNAIKCTVKGKADDLYHGSMQFVNHRRTALQYPLVHWTLCRCQQYGAFSMKALARYQVILLGEQRHIRCEQLAQCCCLNNATQSNNTYKA